MLPHNAIPVKFQTATTYLCHADSSMPNDVCTYKDNLVVGVVTPWLID